MLHGRRLFIATIIAVAVLGSAINAIGPFGAHPGLAYARFIADFEAGRVEQVVQWRDRLEVTEGSESFLVMVPGDVDLAGDLARARRAGGVGMNFAWIPDNWLVPNTPWVPALLLVAGLLIWLRVLLRGRADGPSRPPEPALP